MNRKIRIADVLPAIAVLLTAWAPILALQSFNMTYVQYPSVVRALWFTAGAALLLLLIAWGVLRNFQRAAAVTLLFLLLFFLYGHVFELLSQWLPIRNLLFSALWLLIFAAGVMFILRGQERAASFNQAMLIAAGLLVVFNLGNILMYEAARSQANRASLQQAAGQFGNITRRPDIYYIILDAHTRADLLTRFGYDSTTFLNRLDDMDFYVASCSQANYWLTTFSVGSTLRMEYFGPEYDNEQALPDWAVSATIQNLKQLGYQIVVFETRANDINNQELEEDVFISSPRQETLYENFYPLATLNDFEANLVKTTWLHSWLQLVGNYRHLLPADVVLNADDAVYLEHYRQTYFILEHLPELGYVDSPKFVYAHLLVPHEPFIFDASGRYVYRHTDEAFTEGYRNNVEFIDNQIVEVIERILANSAEPPIIILQGDHGPNGSQADLLMPILNAYHFPYGGNEALYDRISPVNTFRTLFSYYFGMEYETLPDDSYFGVRPNLSEGVLVQNFCD